MGRVCACSSFKTLCFSLEIITRQLLEACTCPANFSTSLADTHATNSSLIHSLACYTFNANCLLTRLFVLALWLIFWIPSVISDATCNTSRAWLIGLCAHSCRKKCRWLCLINNTQQKEIVEKKIDLFCFEVYNWPRFWNLFFL